ncbi:MAG: hypothetical protein HXY25_07805 [Alphaproteobacteria bacterium]|nr:hypothetical protein [Alphaproteobacteria bacterium]
MALRPDMSIWEEIAAERRPRPPRGAFRLLLALCAAFALGSFVYVAGVVGAGLAPGRVLAAAGALAATAFLVAAGLRRGVMVICGLAAIAVAVYVGLHAVATVAELLAIGGRA